MRFNKVNFLQLSVFLFASVSFFSILPQLVKAETPLQCDAGETAFYGKCIKVLQLFGQKNVREASEDTVVDNQIYHASGIVIDQSSQPNRIYVADTGNNRILGFDSLGRCLGNSSLKCTNDLDCPGAGQDTCVIDVKKSADLIFGQPDADSAACNRDNNLGNQQNPTPNTLCLIGYPAVTNIGEYWMRTNFDVDGQGNLYVPDVYNDRVLLFKQPFSTDKSDGKGDTTPDFVWGQDDLNSNSPNKGRGRFGLDNTSIFISIGRFTDHVASRGISVDKDGNLWVADTFNRRVLRFPPNSATADLVLGQPNFTSANAGCYKNAPLNRMCTPTLARVHPETGQLYVIDERPTGFKARILIFEPPFTNGQLASRILEPQQDSPFENFDWDYYLQATGLTFNTYKEGEYANGDVWISEGLINRVILVDRDGVILKVIGAPDSYHRGCDFGNYGRCGQNVFEDFNLCSPGGSIGIDQANNIYLADEEFHRIARYKLPYEADMQGCLPKANGGLFDGNSINSVSAYKFGGARGSRIFKNQLFVKDKYRYLVWENYLEKPIGAKADIVVGQNSENVKIGNTIGGAHHAIDDKDRLWTFNNQHKITVYQLPFVQGAEPISDNVKLYWLDSRHKEVNYTAGGSFAFDKINKKLWISDENNHRLLRISNYEDPNEPLYVDMVLGQPDKDTVECNSGRGPFSPSANSLCKPYDIEFDLYANLYVIENNYECREGNARIIVFMAEDLKLAKGMFPQTAGKKVFVADSFTEPGRCAYNTVDEPGSPVSVAFNKRNQMVIGNDGYYGDSKTRHLRQLWFYNDPLEKYSDGSFVQGQKPDAFIELPMGAAGELNFDKAGNLAILDHTWHRSWVINLDKDRDWLVPLNPDEAFCNSIYDLDCDWLISSSDIIAWRQLLSENDKNANLDYDSNTDIIDYLHQIRFIQTILTSE